MLDVGRGSDVCRAILGTVFCVLESRELGRGRNRSVLELHGPMLLRGALFAAPLPLRFPPYKGVLRTSTWGAR